MTEHVHIPEGEEETTETRGEGPRKAGDGEKEHTEGCRGQRGRVARRLHTVGQGGRRWGCRGPCWGGQSGTASWGRPYLS